MKISILQADKNRPLHVDFDKYTDGDADFKKELVVLMIDNISELMQCLKSAEKDTQNFQKVVHKIKPTIEMLEDSELNATINNIKSDVDKNTSIGALGKMCVEIIKSLEKAIS
jgi:hypothetical protein